MIAKRFNTNINTIQTSNNLKGSFIKIGQSLLIPSALVDASQYTLSSVQRRDKRLTAAAPSGKQKVIHTIAAGDSLWALSKRYDVSTKSIARWNNMGTKSTLKIGDKLAIFIESQTPTSASEYLVRKGDNLSLIAQRLNVSVEELLKWNDLTVDSLLMPGQQLKIAPKPEQG